jgi:hypothetical protein
MVMAESGVLYVRREQSYLPHNPPEHQEPRYVDPKIRAYEVPSVSSMQALCHEELAAFDFVGISICPRANMVDAVGLYVRG